MGVMSVDALLVRLGPEELVRLSPSAVVEFLDEVRFAADVPASVGARRGDRFVFLDEWSATLISPGYGDLESPLSSAVRLGTTVHEGIDYGHGAVMSHPPEVVASLSAVLDSMTVGDCFEPLPDGTPRPPSEWVTDGAWSYPTDETGVTNLAAELLGDVQLLYRQAAAAGQAMLIAVV